VSGQLHAPDAIPRGESPQYPLYRRFCGPQSQSGRRGEEKILELSGTRTPARSQPLYRLRHPGSLDNVVTHPSCNIQLFRTQHTVNVAFQLPRVLIQTHHLSVSVSRQEEREISCSKKENLPNTPPNPYDPFPVYDDASAIWWRLSYSEALWPCFERRDA
jgi:hypothetical protein